MVAGRAEDVVEPCGGVIGHAHSADRQLPGAVRKHVDLWAATVAASVAVVVAVVVAAVAAFAGGARGTVHVQVANEASAAAAAAVYMRWCRHHVDGTASMLGTHSARPGVT